MDIYSATGPAPMWPGYAILIVVLGVHSLWLLLCSIVPIVRIRRPERGLSSPARRGEMARWILVTQVVLLSASIMAWLTWDAFAAKMWPGPDWEYETGPTPTLAILGSFAVQLASFAAWFFVRTKSRLQVEPSATPKHDELRGRWVATVFILATTLLPMTLGLNGNYFLGERRDVGLAVMGAWFFCMMTCAVAGAALYERRRGGLALGPILRWTALGLLGFPVLYIGWAIVQDRWEVERARGYCNRIVEASEAFQATKGRLPESAAEIAMPGPPVPVYLWSPKGEPVEFGPEGPKLWFLGARSPHMSHNYDWMRKRWVRHQTSVWS